MYSKFFIRKPKGFKGAMTFGRVAIKREPKTVYDSKILKFLFNHVIQLNVILLNAIILIVVAPFEEAEVKEKTEVVFTKLLTLILRSNLNLKCEKKLKTQTYLAR